MQPARQGRAGQGTILWQVNGTQSQWQACAYLRLEAEGSKLLRKSVRHAVSLELCLWHFSQATSCKASQKNLISKEVCLLVAHLQWTAH